MEKKELIYEIITKTIELDNLIEEIIQISLGLEEDYVDENGPPENIHQIQTFSYIMEDLGSTKKFEILNYIIPEEKELPKAFREKFHRFYKIRNIFAHSLHPKGVNDKIYATITNWDELYNEHSKLYSELLETLLKTFFIWRPNWEKELK